MLSTLSYPATERLLGLIEADYYAPGLNFIFGQTKLHGRKAFIALPRLRQSFYGLPEDALLHRRFRLDLRPLVTDHSLIFAIIQYK